MASAYGIVHDYGEPQSTFDAGLALQALEYKQKKYDANTIKIEQTLNQFGIKMNQLAREEDREYLYQRVNKLMSGIEGLKGADLGKRSVTQGIIGHIGQALDERVVKQLGIAQNIQDYQTAAMAAKEEGDFSTTNYQTGLRMAEYYAYMNNERDDLKGSLTYTPYNAYRKEYSEAVTSFMKTQEDRTIEVIGGNGRVKEVTVSNLSKTELRNYLPQFLTQKNINQMRIEGAAMFNYNNDLAVSKREDIIEGLVQPLQNEITSIEDKLELKSNVLTSAQKKGLVEEKQKLERLIVSKKQEFEHNIGDTAAEIGGYIIKDKLVDGMVAMHYQKKSINYRKDGVYYERMEAAALDPTTTTGTRGGQIPDNPHLTSSHTSFEGVEDLKQEDLVAETTEKENQYDNAVRISYNDLSTEVGRDREKSAKGWVDSKVTTLTTGENPMSMEAAKYEAMTDYYKATQQYGKWNKLYNAKMEMEKYNSVVKETFKEVTSSAVWQESNNIDGLYEAMTETFGADNIHINGKAAPQYLANNGINSPEELGEFLKTEEGKELKKTIYADYVVEEVLFPSKGYERVGNFVVDKKGTLTKEKYHYIKRLINIVGGEDKITDVLVVTSEEGKILTSKDVLSVIEGDADYDLEFKIRTDSTTGEFLSKRFKTINKPQGKDKSFYSDSAVKGMFGYENYKKTFVDKLNENMVGVVTPMKLTLQAPTTSPGEDERPIFKELSAVFTNPDNNGGTGGTLRWGKEAGSVNIFVNPSDPTEIIITQQLSGSNSNVIGRLVSGETADSPEIMARVPKSQFAQIAPTIYSRMRTNKNAGDLIFYGTETFEGDDIQYPSATPETQKKLTKYYSGNAVLAKASTSQGARNILIEKTGEEFYKENKATFNYALKHPDMFKVKFNMTQDSRNVEVYIKNSSGKDIMLEQLKMTGFSDSDIKKTKVNPQIYITMALWHSALDYKNTVDYMDDDDGEYSDLSFNVIQTLAQKNAR